MAQDNSKKDIFMNAIATIAYSIIFIVSVSCIAIFIQYCITGFKDPVVPVEGLKFEESTIQVNSSNLEEAYLTITATNELSEEILQQDGDYEDITITLKIKNPEVLELEKYEVKLNEPVKIIPKLADDGYLVGGTCIVEANSNDGKWVVVENLTINVDVPIESITIKAENKIGQDVTQAINDKTIKFIKDDTLTFSVETVPARAINPIKTLAPKVAIFPNDDIREDFVILETNGFLTVVGDDAATTGEVTILARILKSYGADESVEENWITQTIVIETSRVELNEIQILNTNYDDESESISIYVGDSEKLKFSARETGQPDVINLNIFLEPVFYTEGDDPFYNLLTALRLTANVENKRENITSPIEISTEIINEDEKNIIWEITATRPLETQEVLNLSISLENYEQTRTLNCAILESLPTYGTIQATDDVELSITKQTNSSGAEYISDNSNGLKDISNNFLTYNQNSEHNLTYTKFVYFLSPETVEQPWKNATGSNIVNISQYGQIIMQNEDGNTSYSSQIQAMGSGTVYVNAYLIRTNSAGQPIDCNYNVITNLDTNIVSVDAINGDYEGCAGLYVYVAATLEPFTVTVDENLTGLTVYYQTANGDKQQVPATGIEIGNTNVETLYVRANSIYALLNNWTSFSIEQVSNDNNILTYEVGRTENEAILKSYHTENPEQLISAEFYFNVIGTVGNQAEDTLNIKLLNSTNNLAVIHLTTKEVPISELKINTNDDFTIDETSGEKSIQLTESLTEEGVSMLSHWSLNGLEYSELPTAEILIREIDKQNGFTSPSSPTYNINAYVVSNADLQQIKNGTLKWPGSEDALEEDDTINYLTGYAEVETDYTNTSRLYILNGNLPANTSLVVVYNTTNGSYNQFNPTDQVIAKPDYFVVNLDSVQMEIYSTTSQPSDEGYDNIMPDSACPTEDNVALQGGSSTSVSIQLSYSVRAQTSASGESERLDILSQRLSLSLDETSSKYFAVSGQQIYLKDGVSAYTPNSSVDSYELISTINATFRVEYYVCKKGEDLITGYLEREITIKWGDEGFKVSPMVNN